MTRAVILATIALILGVLSCAPQAPDVDAVPIAASGTSLGAVPPQATTNPPTSATLPAAETEEPSCAPALVLAGSTLAVRWPALIGRRIRVRVRPVRAIDLTQWLVRAGGQSFIVMAAPDTSWTTEHAFVVLGSTIAPVHGRTALPELALDDSCSS